MQEVTLSLKEYNNLLKDSRDLVLVSLENKHLKRQLDTANEHINDLNDNINLYISLYQSADARADRAGQRLEEYINERDSILSNQVKRDTIPSLY
ncbi:hypothetical protein [Staphylococcus haemolyticus]|uniref:hypothetical protein n=1 Tax=Staphylococcus haemolyticus TaxID=1283 RepID=UPI0029026B5A|nr:hypothetical protein [Staphylococcus haemolyticus]MDU0441570.1 hypothetical protein [Staphylococcus haemolyticus]MDU0473688.1 hypothetical protein [Staphylococcus haemolyticus]